MKQEHIILFDGVCNLCNAAVQFVIRRDRSAKFQFASLQGSAGQELLKLHRLPLNDLHSFVYIENGKAYTKSTGALRVCKQLSGFSILLYGFIIVPKFFRDRVYDIIARYRFKWFGRRNECMIPTAELKARFLD